MRLSVLGVHGKFLARGAAIVLVCSAAVGCSSTVSRFSGGLDDIFTASTPKSGSTVAASNQPYPAAPLTAAPASTVTRGSLPPPAAPVTRQAAAVPARAPEAETLKPVQTADAKVPLPSTPPVERVVPHEKPKQVAAKPAKPEAAPVKTAQATAKPQPKLAAEKPAPKVVAEVKKAPALDPLPTATAQTQAQPQAQPVAYTPPQPAKQAMAEAEAANSGEAPDASGVGKMRWPVRGRVVARYGAKGSQASDGLDIAVPEGTPVKAAENGVVIYAGNGLKEFGNTVLVRHENGLVTVYGHASQLKVTRGEKVTRGQDIALSGMSGTTDTPKLHFEVRKNSSPVDPATFLQ